MKKSTTMTLVAGSLLAALALQGRVDPGWTLPTPTLPTPLEVPSHQAAPTGAAATALEDLTERRTARPGFAREHFGQRWSDAATGVSGARNGCDTRSDILRRDLDDLVIDPGTQGCSPATGTLTDPYTGEHTTYQRRGTSTIDIDHVVSLADAWRSGAWKSDPATRERIANDPLNLLATLTSTNRSKGDRPAQSWPGPTAIGQLVDDDARCSLVARQIAVKAKYELSVTPQERAAMRTALTRCPNQELPDQTSTDVPPPQR